MPIIINPTDKVVLTDTALKNFVEQIVKQIKVIGYYGVCSTASATANKTVTVTPAGFALADGVKVDVRFTQGIPAGQNTTLNVNGTGAKEVKLNRYDSAALNFVFAASDAILTLVYVADIDAYIISGGDALYEIAQIKRQLEELTAKVTAIEEMSGKVIYATEKPKNQNVKVWFNSVES